MYTGHPLPDSRPEGAKMHIFKKWQDQHPSPQSRIAALIIGAAIFPALIPVLLLAVMPMADRALGFDSFFHGWANVAAGAASILAGGALALWTICLQIQLASGTPFPMLPTQKLLAVGPFRCCRNPMTLGTILAYGGIAVWMGSWSALIAVSAIAAALIGYLKIIEEKELQLRFGEEYLEYKQKTPFLLPISLRKGPSGR
jgi:protein-S-isoprenylcysteine O-methyltransferase Ste14